MTAKILTLMAGMLMMSFLGPACSASFSNPELKIAVCDQCHGNDENSPNPSLPSLAGQNAAYLIQQMNNFLTGARKHPVLEPSIEKTGDIHIEVLATYYSNLKANNADLEQVHISPSGIFTNSFSQLIKQGETIYSSCSGCHGMDAEGITPYPRLAGQQLEYLRQQLIHFKTGRRDDMIMKMMTVNLSDEEIKALALYLSTLNQMKLQARMMSEQ